MGALAGINEVAGLVVREFGETATVIDDIGGRHEVTVVRFDPSQTVDVGGASIVDNRESVWVLLSEYPEPTAGHHVELPGGVTRKIGQVDMRATRGYARIYLEAD